MGELGTRLKETRESRGLTIEDAERDTRISRRYLQALESEQFEVIPAPVYARGFLRSYSQYLGLDPQQTLALFPRDDESAALPRGTLRATRENPIPPVSASRPQWQRPTRAGAAASTASPPSPRPFSGAPPQARHPVVVPQTPSEPTIGIDIGVPVPARRLERTATSSARSALVLAAAAVAIAVIVGLAWLISRTSSDSPPGDAGSPAANQANTTTGPTPARTTVPSVPRGVVPDVIGLPSADARLLIAAAGYGTIESREKSPNVARGNVLDQSPAPGTQLSEGQSVRIRVSDGP